MKNVILTSLMLVSAFAFSQEVEKIKVKDSSSTQFNKWSIELGVGQSKGLNPYNPDNNYYSSDPNHEFGKVTLNSYALSARYMISPKFGFKGLLGYDRLFNFSGNGSRDFDTRFYRLQLEGVVNLNRVFGTEKVFGRFGLLFHAGFHVALHQSKTEDKPNIESYTHNYNATEKDGGLVVGFTPQYRIYDRFSIFFDVTLLSNYRQHLAWDGSSADRTKNLEGRMLATSLGISVTLGDSKLHGDWELIKDDRQKEMDGLNEKIGQLENMLQDTDKDGVPDYRDKEPNSMTGIAVSPDGRMVDLNNNTIPDELEKYVNTTIIQKLGDIKPNTNIGGDNTNVVINEQAENEMLKRLINENYITAHFEVDKVTPTTVESIDFVLNYLRKNPESKVEIFGNADANGNRAYNDRLSGNRAKHVKNMLVKAGIATNRIEIKPNGVDSSVNKGSKSAKRLVRRVTFKVS
jgi:OOP family OmpA-OmpF porin